MTKEHLIGRIARATLKGSFNNAEEHFKCAESLSQISIEYAIGVLEEIRSNLGGQGLLIGSALVEGKIDHLKSLLS